MTAHTPVLLQETIELLSPQKGETVVDATVGLGGHARALCRETGERGLLIGIDKDKEALAIAQKDLGRCTAHFYKEDFRNIDTVLVQEKTQHVHKILLDLGVSSLQLDSANRGFSFRERGPLEMSMWGAGGTYHLTAHEIVNEWKEETIETILRGYGEERFARRIAQAIVTGRDEKEITTTEELRDIVTQAVPAWYRNRRIHPATKTFQAIRIAVNDEIQALREFLPKGWNALSKEGKLAVITFHSLEDRIVKNFFRDLKNNKEAQLVNKKPITPSVEEIKNNPRARSAKLRIVQKI